MKSSDIKRKPIFIAALLLVFSLSLHAQWTSVFAPPLNNGASEIQFVSSTTGYMLDHLATYKTTNAGVSWTKIDSNTVTYTRSSMHWVNASEGYVVLTENLGFGNYAGWFKRTSNGGATWTAMQQLPINQYYNTAWFTSATTGYVGGNNGTLLKTTNSGASWTLLTTNTTNAIRQIHFVSATAGYAVGDYGLILKTTNAGTNWTGTYSNINFSGLDCWFTHQDTGVVVGVGGILRTTNGGSSWNLVQNQIIGGQFTGVHFPANDTAYVINAGGSGIMRSTDGGANWLAMNPIGSGMGLDIWFTSGTTGYAATSLDGVWKTTVSAFVCPTVSAGNPSYTVCTGQTIILSGTPSAPNTYNYNWSVLNGSATANPPNTQNTNVVMSQLNDTSEIVVTMTDPLTGCPATTDTVSVITTPSVYTPLTNGPTFVVLICPGDSAVLDLGPGAQSYTWQPGGLTQTLTVSTPGQYNALVYACGNYYNYFFAVNYDTPQNCSSSCSVSAGADHVNCQQPIQLQGQALSPGNDYTYSWSPANLLVNPNSLSAFGTFGGPGVYNQQFVLTMTDTVTGCIATDTVIVSSFMPVIGNRYLCPGDSITLDFGPGATSYNWQYFTDTNNVQTTLNQLTQTLVVTQPGTYLGFAVFPGCGAITSFVTVIDSCLSQSCSVNAGPDTTFCQLHGQLQATPGSPGNYSYSWSPAYGLSNPNIANPVVDLGVNNQSYVVTMTDNTSGCQATDTVVVNAYYWNIDTLYMCNNNPITYNIGPGGFQYTVQFTDTSGNFQFTQVPGGVYVMTQPAQYLFIAYYTSCGALTSLITVLDSCNVPVNNVWPGDCNYDLTANMADVLNIGIGYNTGGPVRPNASNQWYAQPMNDWTQNFINCNYKHADANGDGIINVNDTLPVALNYGLTHPYSNVPELPVTASTPTLELVANYDTCGLQTLVTIDIRMGNSTIPVDSIYGVAFRLSFEPHLVDTMLTGLTFAGSWLGNIGSDLIGFQKPFRSTGLIDVCEVGNNQLNRYNGQGSVGSFQIVTTDNLSGITVLHLDLSQVTAVTLDGIVHPVTLVNDSVIIDPSVPAGIHNKPAAAAFQVYPNPANEMLTIKGTPAGSTIELVNLLGEVVLKQNAAAAITRLDVSHVSTGVYFARVTGTNGTHTEKITITR